jgi:hypothetical protein
MVDFNESVFLQLISHFTGSETVYRHSFMSMIRYTEGAKFVAERCGAYWLLDEIAVAQAMPNVVREEFQLWMLTVNDKVGVLTCEDGNLNTVFKKKIEFTSFPMREFKLYFCGNTIMLPSEY